MPLHLKTHLKKLGRPKVAALVLALLLGLSVLIAMAGGIIISSKTHYGGQQPLAIDSQLIADIWLQPKERLRGIPLLLLVHSEDGPYGLRIQIWDDNGSYESLEITRIATKWSTGEESVMLGLWGGRFEPCTVINSLAGAVIKKEVYALRVYIADFIQRQSDVEIAVEGHVIDKAGRRRPIAARNGFTITSRTRIGVNRRFLND